MTSGADDGPVFTVFTPTYNRARTLPRVYGSLRAQTFRSLEWLIVDDGSSDGTGDLVRPWLAAAFPRVRYVWQPNGGKPSAYNRALREARGEFFLVLDSDDWCEPWALERLWAYWQGIPERERPQYTGVTVLAKDERGRVLGKPFPQRVMDCTHVEMMTRHAYVGDKWGFHRTDVVRQFPFPECRDRFIPEGVVWTRIAQHYRMRFVNDPLLIKEYQPDGLSRNRAALLAGSPRGALLYYRAFAEHRLPPVWRARTMANAVRCALHARESVLGTLRELGHGVLWPIAAIGGGAAWMVDRLRLTVGQRR